MVDSAEEWRSVIGFEGWYDVSDFGRVKRTVPGKGTTAGKILPGYVMPIGYRCVSMSRGSDASKKQWYVHHMVARAFLGERPAGFEINHIDGDKLNNRVTNLEYVTRRENARHAVRIGLIPHGEAVHNAKLTEGDVLAIRASGDSAISLGKTYGVGRGYIWMIKNRRVWKGPG